MPSKFFLTSEPATVRRHFAYANTHEFPPRDSIAPTEPVMIVRRGHGGKREAHLVRWGLVPAWVRDFDRLGLLAVARIETILDKPSFRGGMRHKRCIVPANGFYIWSGPRHSRQRHTVVASDRGLMGFAAIYEEWMGADGSEIDSMAIITQSAPAAFNALTDRAPALVSPENQAAWLDCRGVREAEALALLERAAADFALDP